MQANRSQVLTRRCSPRFAQRRRLALGSAASGAVAWTLLASASLAQAPSDTAPPPAESEPPAPGGAAAPATAPSQPSSAPAPATAPSQPPTAPPAADATATDLGVEEAPTATSSAQHAPGDEALDEVVVTVDRRSKDLQDYSGTAAAFSEAKLTNLGVNSVQDLSQLVPGLQIGVNNAGATIYIRGVGSDNTTELGDPAVAVHLDGVYLPRFRGLGAAWLDVERVEANSGPQGTLRGRNAVGGTINIISRRPVLGEFQANGEITFGNYRQRIYQAMLNVPVGDSVALRVAGISSRIDPTWVNAGPIDHLPGAQDQDNYALKGQLRMQPSSKLDIIVGADYSLERGTGYIGANVIGLLNNMNDNGTPLDLTDDYLDPIDPNSLNDPRQVYQRGRYPTATTKNWGVHLDMTYDAGPVLFELLGSYRYLDWWNASGSNAGYFIDPNDLRNQTWDGWSFAQQQNNDSHSTVGEFRIFSPDDQQLVWSVGLFGFYEDQGAFLGQITGDPDGGFNEFNMPSTVGYSYAGYADMTFSVTQAFRVIGGLRYSIEHKDRLGGIWMIGANLPQNGFDLCGRQNQDGECVELGLASQDIGRYGTEGFQYRLGDRTNYTAPDANSTKEERVNFYLDGIKSFGARDQTAIALCNDPEPQFNSNGEPVAVDRIAPDENGNFRCVAGIRDSVPDNFANVRPQNGERDDHYLDFRVGAEYDLAKDNLLYTTLSSGHKAGGFNDSIPDPDSDGEYLTPDYGPETAYALEIGSKNLLLDRKLRLNASAFAFLYEGLQFQTIITVGEAPPLNPDGTVATNPATGLPYADNRGGSAARQNAQETATSFGLDLDAIYALPFGLEVEFHALFQDARFPDGTLVNDGRLGLGAAPAQVDIGGYWLPRVSPYTFNYSLSQLIFSSVGSFDWIVQGQTRGEHYMSVYNGDGTRFAPRGPGWGINPITGEPEPIEADTNQQYEVLTRNLQRLDDRVPTYTAINLGVGWRHPDGRLAVRGFVNNVFDVAYATSIGSTSGNNIRFYNNPLMAGVRVRMEW